MWMAVLFVTVGANFALFVYYCALTVKMEKNKK